MSSYIISPKTGRLILIGGETYQKLLSTKKYAKEVLNSTPARQSSKRGRGAKTRGWKEASPKRGAERSALKEKCGDRCFLKPSSNGFPICSSGKECRLDCRGISSAYVRARQWGHTSIASKAKYLEKRYC